jgi:CBS domain-containing protein
MMTQIAEFLVGYPPFDALSDDEVARIASASRIEDHESGAAIMNGFVEQIEELAVVVSGQVELWNTPQRKPDGPDEILGPGGVFGYSGMLTGSAIGPLALAAGPVRVYRIPGHTVRPVFSSLAGAEFLARKLTVAQRIDASSVNSYGTVGELLRAAPVVGSADMTVQQAAQKISEHHGGYIVIPGGDGRFGVLTDRDIRARVVATGSDLQQPVRGVMTFPAVTALTTTPASEVLVDILERGVTCVPVIDPRGELRGVVVPEDFVNAPAGAGVSLRDQIMRADSMETLADRGRRMRYVAADLLRRGRPSYEVTAVLSVLTDAVVRRALEMVLASRPDLDPGALTWLSLGSNARRESVLSSDVDSAVSFDESVSDLDQFAAYRAAFAEVGEMLRRSGLGVDVNGATADMPLFSRTHSQWREVAGQWLASPLDNKGMILASLLLDGRPIWGDPGATAVSEVFRQLRQHPGTMRLLLAESLSYKAKLRSMRDVLSRRGGTFDIKGHALIPVINIARWAALSVQSPEVGTRGRLSAAAGSAMLSDDNANTLIEVFEVLQKIRLTYQVAQLDRGESATDVLTMQRLSPLDRSLVGQAVREVSAVQRRMDNMSHYMSVKQWTEPEVSGSPSAGSEAPGPPVSDLQG